MMDRNDKLFLVKQF